MPRNNHRGRAHRAGPSAATTAPPARGATGRGGHGEIRIVGGAWRGRKVSLVDATGLRPTPDRVRETLFNWLQFEIAGQRCLDLFAGSGALGLEALSRAAAEVVFVERERAAAAAIEDTLARFGCDRGRVEHADAFGWLETVAPRPFDIVFVDPPYGERWLERVARLLEHGGWLAPQSRIYLEGSASDGVPSLPPGWCMARSKRAGDVGYHLARRGAPAADESEREGSP